MNSINQTSYRPSRDLLRSKIFDIARTRFSHHSELAALEWLEIANKTLLEPSFRGTDTNYGAGLWTGVRPALVSNDAIWCLARK